MTVEAHAVGEPVPRLDERDVAGLARAAGIEIADHRRAGLVQFASMFREMLDQLDELDSPEISYGDPFDPDCTFDARWES